MISNQEQQEEYILLIMNCEKYAWKADIQKDSWLKTIPSSLPYFHIVFQLFSLHGTLSSTSIHPEWSTCAI